MSDDEINPKDKTYPVSCETRIFPTRAATENGELWNCGGDKDTYGLPGKRYAFGTKYDKLSKIQSGSAIAIALAAGLAAMILYCATPHNPSSFSTLRNQDQMNNAFQAIGVHQKYILVWNIFEKITKIDRTLKARNSFLTISGIHFLVREGHRMVDITCKTILVFAGSRN